MLNNILKLNGVQELNKIQQKVLFGGRGNCTIKCNSGVNIENAPNGSQAVQDHACQNQGGASGGFICVGGEQPWIQGAGGHQR